MLIASYVDVFENVTTFRYLSEFVEKIELVFTKLNPLRLSYINYEKSEESNWNKIGVKLFVKAQPKLKSSQRQA